VTLLTALPGGKGVDGVPHHALLSDTGGSRLLQKWRAMPRLKAHLRAHRPDLLISAVGRRNIESRLAALGHSDPARLTPFLKTSELFRLRSDTGAAVKYLNLPAGEKYAFLAGLETPLAAEKVKRSPFGVDKLEWPASPSDVCALMQYFAAGGSDAALDILGLNKGLDIPPAFSYAGLRTALIPGVKETLPGLQGAGAHGQQLKGPGIPAPPEQLKKRAIFRRRAGTL